MNPPPDQKPEKPGAEGRSASCFASLGASTPPPFDPVQGTPGTYPADTVAPTLPTNWPAATAVPRQPGLNQLPVGAHLRDTFLVQDLEIRGGDTPHTVLVLQNAAGRIRSAPFWAADPPRIPRLHRSALVEVSGTIATWRDRRQLHVDSLRLLPDDPSAWERLLPSLGDRGPWWALLDAWRQRLAAPRLARALDLVFGDAAFRARFEQCPASTAGHHARLGGLLQHTCEVAQLALAAARLQPQADAELVLAGALLHDIGKVDSYTWQGAFDCTPDGYAVGHVVLGVLRLDRALEREGQPPCSGLERALLHHLILSHHGQHEFGAPVTPMTLEAEILSHADRLSARAASIAETLSDPDYFTAGGSITSRTVWQLDHRRLWRARGDWGRTDDPTGC
jgi:3'-5' exoribonuclease